MQQSVTRPTSSRQRPLSVTILAILAAVGGVGAVLGVLAGSAIHGLDSLDAIETIMVLAVLAMSALYLAVAYGAWTLKPWGWTLGVVAGVASIVLTTAVLIRGWADLMVDAPAARRDRRARRRHRRREPVRLVPAGREGGVRARLSRPGPLLWKSGPKGKRAVDADPTEGMTGLEWTPSAPPFFRSLSSERAVWDSNPRHED